jgi:hypothetical protein
MIIGGWWVSIVNFFAADCGVLILLRDDDVMFNNGGSKTWQNNLNEDIDLPKTKPFILVDLFIANRWS